MSKKISEVKRILELETAPSTVPDLTPKLRRPGGKMRLFPIQNRALWSAYQAKGMLGLISVGSGKTLISVLLPRVLGAKRTILLVPASMRDPFDALWHEYAQHWYVGRIKVLSYEQLSSAKSRNLLLRLKPDLIIADEAHYLRHRDSARTRRVVEYLRKTPSCRFVAMSGTLTNRSILDYAHLSVMALRGGSPLPRDWHTLNAWSQVLDAGTKATKHDWRIFGAFFKGVAGPRARLTEENARKAFRHRLTRTPGVVATRMKDIGSSLIIHQRVPMVPPAVQKAMEDMQRTWKAPNGDEISDPMTFARIGRQLSQGFYYEWEWPDGVVDTEWLKARSNWNKWVRTILQNNRLGLDSPLLVTNALRDGRLKHAKAAQALIKWEQVKTRPEPPTVARWISPFLVKDAVQWAKAQDEPVIIWYDTLAVEAALRHLKIPTYGSGTNIPAEKAHLCAASIAVHGTGKNLQAWHNQIILAPPANGKTWEQLLGRMHRTGQQADEVHCTVYVHTDFYRTSMRNARRDAQYIYETQGQRQRLSYATTLSK